MAWTSPKSWAVNEVVTAANVNTHLRDNLNWLANDKPRCRATRTAVQSFSSGEQAIGLTGAENYDVGSMHDTVTNPSRLTVPTGGGGIYALSAYLRTAAVGAGFTRLIATLRVNGSTLVAEQVLTPPGGTGILANVATDFNLVATDYVELVVNHNNTASLDITFAAVTARWTAF